MSSARPLFMPIMNTSAAAPPATASEMIAERRGVRTMLRKARPARLGMAERPPHGEPLGQRDPQYRGRKTAQEIGDVVLLGCQDAEREQRENEPERHAVPSPFAAQCPDADGRDRDVPARKAVAGTVDSDQQPVRGLGQ